MGKFDTHGGTFVPDGFMQIEAGGTHEHNPNGGVQIGVDPNGVPNMVEQGENIYDDFVYSSRIKADPDILEEFHFPKKYAGKSYSEIVNEYVDAKRPNDPISNKTMNSMLTRLASAQEEQKKRIKQAVLDNTISNMSLEELEALEASILQGADAGQEQQPQMFAAGGSLDNDKPYVDQVREWLKDNHPDERYSDAVVFAIAKELENGLGSAPINSYSRAYNRIMYGNKNLLRKGDFQYRTLYDDKNIKLGKEHFNLLVNEYGIPADEAFAIAFPRPVRITNNPNLGNSYNADFDKRINTRQKLYNQLARNKEGNIYDYPVDDINDNKQDVDIVPISEFNAMLPVSVGTPVFSDTQSDIGLLASINSANSLPLRKFSKADLPSMSGLSIPDVNPNVPTTVPDKLRSLALEQALAAETANDKAVDMNNVGYPTALRYAGAVTSGLMGLYNAFQKPDKYKVGHVTPQLMRTKLSTINPVYNPSDVNVTLNSVLSSGAGTARGLRNSGIGPSVGAAMVALDNNIGKNIGGVRTQVAGYNANLLNNIIGQINANRQAETQVDMNREQTNINHMYDAGIRNMQNDLTEQQLNYNAEGQHYGALGNQIDQVSAALSSMGRENMVFNMINQNPAYSYYLMRNGAIGYNPNKKCGGLLKKYKK